MAINGFGYNEKNDSHIVVVNNAVYEVTKEYLNDSFFIYKGEADEFDNNFVDNLLPWTKVSQRLRDIHHDLLNRF